MRVRSDDVQRILIVGCGGSGKSVLARRLGDRLGLPVIHLDEHYYDQDWNTLPPEDFAILQQDLVAQPCWIIDGNYASTLPIRLAAADTVIFLDLPPATCLWSIARRRLCHRGGQHPQIGVYDRINLSFLRYVLRYRRTMRPRVQALIANHAPHADLITMTSRRQAARLIHQLPAHESART